MTTMNECPCDLCITRAICLNRDYRVLLTCQLVRGFCQIESGNLDPKRLEIFCKSMDLKLIKYRSSAMGHTSYYIEGRKLRNKIDSMPVKMEI